MADIDDDRSNEHAANEQLTRLEAARKLVLSDPTCYSPIVEGILPIIGANARLELRRWGADFLAEAFASPVLAVNQKQSLALVVLDTLKAMLEIPGEDPAVLKSVVQASASIYPLVFRHIVANPNDRATWGKMTAIKSRILRIWDSAIAGVRICCVKFVQRVIQVQTPGTIADPRRPDQNEISLTLVPRNHALIPPSNLEAEASGLLDRLLGIFQDDARQVLGDRCSEFGMLMRYRDAIVVNATLNCLGVLIRSRPTAANRILSAILNFNPLAQSNGSPTPKQRVMAKSMERTTRALLVNVNKQNPNGPLASRIQQYIERLAQSRIEILDEGSRKRAAPSEPTDGLDQSKRARLGAEMSERSDQQMPIPPLPSGPISVAQLFTLTADEALTSFDVQQFPIEMVVQLALPVIYRLDQASLQRALEAVRSRLHSRAQQIAESSSLPTVTGVAEDDDDYEPEFEPAEDDEQILNKMDSGPSEPTSELVTALGPFKFPPPAPLSEQEVARVGQDIIRRVFGTINVLEEPASANKPEAGINRLAASTLDRNAWITLLTRLAARAPSGLEDSTDTMIKKEDVEESALGFPGRSLLSNSIRESLYRYVIEDFRSRIDTAIAWLNEEWYNDHVQTREREDAICRYEGLMLRVLDGILPYLDSRDKLFTRFVAELPEINQAVLERVKSLARDPERVGLTVNTIHYLILFRPPIRELCLDALVDLWMNYDDASTAAAKLLSKWRPHALEREKPPSSPSDAATAVEEEAYDPTLSLSTTATSPPAPLPAATAPVPASSLSVSASASVSPPPSPSAQAVPNSVVATAAS